MMARRLAAVVFVALALFGWQVYSRYIAYAVASLIHVTASVAISFTLGVAIALVGYYFAIFDLAIYGRLSPFLNSFSAIGWAFLAMIWFGVNESAVIFTTSAALLPFAIINAGAGLRELNPEIVEMATSFTRSSRRQIIWVILPMMFPYLFATIRL